MAADRSNNSRSIADISRAKKQRTIMSIDDCQVDRKTYRRYLQTDLEYEYTFLEAESGEDALEIYLQNRVDLVLLDYLLPDMDGLEWFAKWQQQSSENRPPVIVLTGQGDENIAVQFIKMGAADYFVKGQITAEKLKLSVRREIALRQLEHEKKEFADTVKIHTEANQLLQNKVEQYKISEQLIRNREEKHRRAIANAPIPIIIHAEDGEILQINRAWTELSGYGIKEIPTIADWTEKAYGKRQEIMRSVIDRLYELDRRVDEGEFEILTSSGQVRIWNFSSAPLGKLLDGRRLVISAAKDVTAIKQAEIDLQKSEAKFRNTFEQAAVGIAHVAPNGKWLKVNQKLCHIVGYTKEELLQKTFQDITHPEDLSTDLEYVRQMLAEEISTYSMEKRYIRKDGTSVWINLTVSLVKNSDGKPDYFISVIEDISDRKNLESSLQTSLSRLSNLHQLDKAILEAEKPQAIAKTAINNIHKFLTCRRTSIVTFDWERKTATILATQGEGNKLVGNGFQVSLDVWQNLIAQLENRPPDRDYIVTYLSQLPQLSTAIPPLEEAELDCFISFPLESNGNLLGILKLWVKNPDKIALQQLKMVSEVCDLVAIALQQAHLYRQIQNYALELEARVVQRTAQLEEINQELKAFSYSISHDLKAPLRAIQGFATAIQEDYAENLDDLGREYARRLVTSAQHMERLIQDLLAYSRLSRAEIQIQPINLSLIVSQAIEQLESEITMSQAKIIVEEPLSTMLGNRTVLRQIIGNLLSNAIKFVAPGITPQVRIWTEIRGGSMAYPEKNRVRLWIADNGIGIDPQHQERIFRVFERLHGNEAYSGTGIGLAIVKKGMQRLGGSFGVESELNRGSRFWIEGLL